MNKEQLYEIDHSRIERVKYDKDIDKRICLWKNDSLFIEQDVKLLKNFEKSLPLFEM